MSKYKGLFTYDVDNHRYLPIANIDGIIDTMDYEPKEPLIKDEKIRKAIRAWLAIQEQPIVAAAITRTKDHDGFFNYCLYGYIAKARISGDKAVVNNNLTAIDFEFRSLEKIEFERHHDYTIAELCGEEDE